MLLLKLMETLLSNIHAKVNDMDLRLTHLRLAQTRQSGDGGLSAFGANEVGGERDVRGSSGVGHGAGESKQGEEEMRVRIDQIKQAVMGALAEFVGQGHLDRAVEKSLLRHLGSQKADTHVGEGANGGSRDRREAVSREPQRGEETLSGSYQLALERECADIKLLIVHSRGERHCDGADSISFSVCVFTRLRRGPERERERERESRERERERRVRENRKSKDC
jgi:hypothetical protein